jgi:ketosteroid isomerase-like protein
MRWRGVAGDANGTKFFMFLCILGLVGCMSGPPDTRVADEAAIRAADADWVKAAQTRQVEKWIAFYSDDATVLPPNDKAATSKNDIRKAVGDLLGLPDLSITWSPTKVEVSRAGDIAYLYGAYEVSWKDPDGKQAVDRGKNVEIWKKQADGSWKCAVDTWNSDLPAELPPS